MIVAMPVWGNRISPVLDSAETLVIMEIKDARVTERQFKSFQPEKMNTMVAMMQHLRIDHFICGAITAVQSFQPRFCI
jgi:predicted Fe-Mo cluster-binding NifX family protein